MKPLRWRPSKGYLPHSCKTCILAWIRHIDPDQITTYGCRAQALGTRRYRIHCPQWKGIR